ncbi:hypothetical protein HOK00_03565 [bacterium]|jgi:hypothetical protein|nr:hypothetical protein [bacterium]
MFSINKNHHFNTIPVQKEKIKDLVINLCLEEDSRVFEKVFEITNSNKETIAVLLFNQTADFKIIILNDFYKSFDFDNFVEEMI